MLTSQKIYFFLNTIWLYNIENFIKLFKCRFTIGTLDTLYSASLNCHYYCLKNKWSWLGILGDPREGSTNVNDKFGKYSSVSKLNKDTVQSILESRKKETNSVVLAINLSHFLLLAKIWEKRWLRKTNVSKWSHLKVKGQEIRRSHLGT